MQSTEMKSLIQCVFIHEKKITLFTESVNTSIEFTQAKYSAYRKQKKREKVSQQQKQTNSRCHLTI